MYPPKKKLDFLRGCPKNVIQSHDNDNTARNYMWFYRDTNNLPPKNARSKNSTAKAQSSHSLEVKIPDLESYKSMTKEELIQELIRARITEARLKKVTK